MYMGYIVILTTLTVYIYYIYYNTYTPIHLYTHPTTYTPNYPYRHPLPDEGLHENQRVGDPHIGLESIQQLEDVVLVCDKKSEVSS